MKEAKEIIEILNLEDPASIFFGPSDPISNHKKEASMNLKWR